jgi:hypothetical protein
MNDSGLPFRFKKDANIGEPDAEYDDFFLGIIAKQDERKNRRDR